MWISSPRLSFSPLWGTSKCLCMLADNYRRQKHKRTLFDVCGSFFLRYAMKAQSLCDKRYGPVFKSELLRPVHTTCHITSLLQTSKSKNIGFSSLKNRFMIDLLNIDVNLECVHMTSLSVQIISFA